MTWLSRLKEWAIRDPVKRVNDTFVPREWDDYFGGLALDERRAVSARVCRKVLSTVSIRGEDVEQAITALTHGQVGPDLPSAIRSLVVRIEGEYESLVGDDESNLSCSDPVIDDAF